MTTTYSEATDEIYTLFNEAWKANAASIVGYVPELRFKGIQERAIPDGSQFWARVSKQTVLESQATLSDCVIEPGAKRYDTDGLVFIQLFCPKSNDQSYQLGEQLAMIARDAFRGKTTPNKIWFRNARINEIPDENLWIRFNVVTEFQYDEIG